MTLLPALPAETSFPLLIVTHFPPDRESLLPSLLAPSCAITVKEAEDKEEIQPGIAYLAPPNYHLLVDPDFRLSLSSDEPVLYSRPSIDVLFESAADAYGSGLLGIVLTGANQDGARGLRTICDLGGRAWIQSAESAESPAMPLAALEACPEGSVLALEEMARTLRSFPVLK
jgi:two-component system chemotaxis response regulator CheB